MNLFRPLLSALLSLVAGVVSARPLALGPNGVDPEDLTGDAADMAGDVHSVWAGTHGVAVWLASRADGTVSIIGGKFDAAGQLMSSPVTLIDRASGGMGLSISGGELLLVWQTSIEGVLARRITPDLAWLDPAPALLASRNGLPTSYQFQIRTAANAQRHAVVLGPATYRDSLTFIRLGPTELPVQETFAVTGDENTTISDFAVAARADGFLIAWEAAGSQGAGLVQARTTGMVGVATGPLRTLATSAGGVAILPRTIAAAPLGDGYAVAWTWPLPGSAAPDLTRQWRRLDASGAAVAGIQEMFPLDSNYPGSIYVFPYPHSITLQPVNGGLLALSSEMTPGTAEPYRQIIHRLLSADGTTGPVRRLGEVQAMVPEMIDVHTTASGPLAVGEVRTTHIYSQRKSAVAAPLTPAFEWSGPSHVLSTGIPEQQACAVACRGTDYLVVWQDGRDGHSLATEIRGRFFALNGSPLGASFRISNRTTDDISPAVAASGGKYLVTWTVSRPFAWARTANDDILAAFVTAPGTVSPSFSLAANKDLQENGVAIAGGPNGGFFAAWRSGPATAPDDDDIHGCWIDGNGSAFPQNGFPLAASQGKERAVSVAGGATTYGIVWRGQYGGSNIFGAVVPASPPATPVTPDKVMLTTGVDAHAPEIASNGSHYRAVWRVETGTDFTVHSATLSEAGIAGAPVKIGEGSGGERYERLFEPAIVPWSGGWQVFWHEEVVRGDPPNRFAQENRVQFVHLDAAGEVTGTDHFAPRFIDHDTLVTAAAPNGSILIVYPLPKGKGREPLRTGALETVLLYPDRPAVDPIVSVSIDDSLTTLRWKFDPWFPPDPGVCEMSTGLQQWLPVPQFPALLQVLVSGEEAVVRFPDFGGERRFFRLNSSAPGTP
ncbi:MAG TPA: hypothetical protein VG796_30940 [Verrucomicrobiales bacterium]|nr:hypothetical protein [Verrucomicrobiales bacterium]